MAVRETNFFVARTHYGSRNNTTSFDHDGDDAGLDCDSGGDVDYYYAGEVIAVAIEIIAMPRDTRGGEKESCKKPGKVVIADRNPSPAKE